MGSLGKSLGKMRILLIFLVFVKTTLMQKQIQQFDRFNQRTAGRITTRFEDPLDDIPVLRNCSSKIPCEYEEGDCTKSGDSGCDSGLVCGVDNCGTIIVAWMGAAVYNLDLQNIGEWRKM